MQIDVQVLRLETRVRMDRTEEDAIGMIRVRLDSNLLIDIEFKFSPG